MFMVTSIILIVLKKVGWTAGRPLLWRFCKSISPFPTKQVGNYFIAAFHIKTPKHHFSFSLLHGN